MLTHVTFPRFLLAVLQIDRICVARTVKKIKLALTSMPRELDDLYRETVERIRRQSGEDGELGMRVLSWVTHTKRPLHVDELAHGLAVEYDDDEGALDELDIDNLLSSRSLVDVCAGLVVIDPRSQIIRLVHYTTQEYFDKERLELFKTAEVDISRASLTYLSYAIANIAPSDEIVSNAIRSHPFLTYASLFWSLHVGEIGEITSSRLVMQQALTYVNDPIKVMFSAMVLRKLLLRPGTYARVFDDVHRKRRGNLIALEAASECGLIQLVKFLLNHSAGSESALDSAMTCASAEGHTEVVALLIERGASVHSLTEDSSNALQKACKGGHFGVVKLLLQHGANANTSDRWMWTPLHHAAHGSHSDLVVLLLENDADPNSRTPLGLTACHLAASRGDLETIRHLLNANYDLGLTTRDRYTPLHKAAEERRLDVCRLLLQRGSDVQAKNRLGQTALDLVDNGASPEVMGIFTPYIYAARGPESLPSSPEIPVTPSPAEGQNNPDQGPIDEQTHVKKWIDQVKMSTNAEAGINSEQVSKDSTRKPKGNDDLHDSQAFSLADTDDNIDLSQLPYPWKVPKLRLIDPTPPSTEPSSPKVKGEDEQTHEHTSTAHQEDHDEFIEQLSEEIKIRGPANISRAPERDLPNSEPCPQDDTNADPPPDLEQGPEGDKIWPRVLCSTEIKDPAKDTSAHIDADAKITPSIVSSMPIGQIQALDDFAPLSHSTADTDASKLSHQREVPSLRLVESTPPDSRSSTPVIQPQAASGEDLDDY